jgi:hypothetical protein
LYIEILCLDMIIELRPLRGKAFVGGVHFHGGAGEDEGCRVEADRAGVDADAAREAVNMEAVVFYFFTAA